MGGDEQGWFAEISFVHLTLTCSHSGIILILDSTGALGCSSPETAVNSHSHRHNGDVAIELTDLNVAAAD